MFNYIKPSRQIVCFCSHLLRKNIFSSKCLHEVFLPISGIKNTASQLRLYSALQGNDHLPKKNLSNLLLLRYKSKGKKNQKHKTSQFEEEEDDDYDEEEDELNDDEDNRGKGQVKTYKVDTLRADAILKLALGIQRKRVEDGFYHHKVVLNGKVLSKKSTEVQIGDVLDLIKESNSDEQIHLNVSRVEILSIKPDEDSDFLLLKVRRAKSLNIERYY